MSLQKAIVVVEPTKAALVSDRAIPSLRDEYILVKTVAVALNPTDWKHIDFGLASPGCLIGCDYAGVVEAVGPKVKKPFKKGDRIAGFAHGGNSVQPEDGAFAEYIVVKGDLQMPIPASLSFEEAATLGVGINTVGQALYQSLKLAPPSAPLDKPQYILVYGGSTATGTLGIQFARLSGYTVLATCSPRNFDLVRSLGAAHVFDYKDANSAAEIRKLTNDQLTLAFDTISSEQTAAYCGNALSSKGGDYTNLLQARVPRDDVRSRGTLAYSVLGEAFKFGPNDIPAIPTDRAFAESFWPEAEKLLASGQLKVHPPAVHPGGLKGVLDGLQLMREDKVSGQKLVYKVAETP